MKAKDEALQKSEEEKNAKDKVIESLKKQMANMEEKFEHRESEKMLALIEMATEARDNSKMTRENSKMTRENSRMTLEIMRQMQQVSSASQADAIS